MGDPKITDKRWTIDLEKRIQESHYEANPSRYSFDPKSDKELFVIDTILALLRGSQVLHVKRN